jgi:hypothetical protein
MLPENIVPGAASNLTDLSAGWQQDGNENRLKELRHGGGKKSPAL